MNIKEKMHSGELYYPGDEALMKEQLAYLDKLYDFNMTRPTEQERRKEMLKEMFAEIGEDCYIEPPLHTNFGGRHVHFGHSIYANFNLTLVDDTHIYVGDYTMFGPNVTVATAGHPVCLSPGRKDISIISPYTLEVTAGLAPAHDRARHHHRRQRRDRRWQRGYKGYSFECRCGGQPLSDPAGNRRVRPGVLLQEPEVPACRSALILKWRIPHKYSPFFKIG